MNAPLPCQKFASNYAQVTFHISTRSGSQLDVCRQLSPSLGHAYSTTRYTQLFTHVVSPQALRIVTGGDIVIDQLGRKLQWSV